MTYERGSGDLDWQRSLVQTFGQRMFRRFIFAARADGSVLDGKQLPVQQLIEVGGAEGLPGYEYKEFAGDQALVARGTIGFLLPFQEQPLRFNRLTLPAIGPQIQVGLFGGVTSASSTTRAQLNALDWKTTDGWRGTFDVRLRFFGGAFSIGASRAIDHKANWKAAFGVGGVL